MQKHDAVRALEIYQKAGNQVYNVFLCVFNPLSGTGVVTVLTP